MRCSNCKFENPQGFKFCGECGMPLTEQPSEHKPQQTYEPERRQLTVMFCDLVGSTTLSEQLDPEELRELVRSYQKVCAEVISRFEGHIAQYLGDGLLVYFGYPVAHEDDAQRAVRTGLGILEEIEKLNIHLQRDRGIKLAVRLGIHTGLVVVGEMGGGEKREQLALGDTPNIASRVQGIAEPSTVVISAATYRLIQEYFECHDLGYHKFKGVTAPVQVYRVLRGSGALSRFEAAIGTKLTPLVGREKEVEILLDRWEHVKRGEGQVVLISGEPGIGKSRLLQVLRQRVSGEAHVWLKCRCLPYYKNSSLYPMIDLLERTLDFRREDSTEEKLKKLENALSEYHLALEDTVPILASFLSIPLPDRYPPLNLTPQKQKEKTMEALLAWAVEVATNQPVLFVIEDLHWVDPSTVEFLNLVLDRMSTARIFTILTFRLEFSSPWAMHQHLTSIALSRLDRKEAEVMVKGVVGEKTLPAEIVQQIVAKTDGVPLFVEELTKMVIESGFLREENGNYVLTGSLPPLAIPITLQDSLMARLDRLATVREVAQLGATLGREFTYELIRAVSSLDESTLQRELSRLVEAELLYQVGLPPQIRYCFKHALIRDAAYQSLLKSKRQQYHQRIAQVLEEQFSETVETQPELLAYHYTESGLSAQAIVYWQKAGQRAVERSANMEAISYLTKGLELLKTLPDTLERTQQELMLQMTLGAPLMATKGYGAPEVEKAYARARELCQHVGETPQLFRALWGLWGFYSVRAEHQTAHELAEQFLTLTQRQQYPALFLAAYSMLGPSSFWLGELVSARAYLDKVIALYDLQQHRSYAFLYGQDPGVLSLSYMTWTLWCLGYPDQALKRSHEAITLAQEIAHSFSLVHALTFATLVHHIRREEQTTQELAEAAISLSAEQGFPYLLAVLTVVRGWTLAEQGQKEEGVAQMHQGIAAYKATGAELGGPYWLALLSEVYGKGGRVKEGLTVVDEALALINKSGERLWEAEIYRLKGELLLMQVVGRDRELCPPAETLMLVEANQTVLTEAETCFRQAIDVARRQSAKSLELRAVMSLSRLLQKQGKKEEARKMLSEIYSWFTEGFDTKDLKEAKALIEKLS